MPKNKKQKKCRVCGITKHAFLVIKRKDRRVRCDQCETARIRELEAKAPKVVEVADIVQRCKILLTETDHWDYASYRSDQNPKRLKRKDAYRQSLREIIRTCKDPSNVIFPKKPK